MEITTFTEQVAAAVAAADFGTASARKSGRNPRWPYTPVIVWNDGTGHLRQDKRQVLGKAFETREEAIAFAERQIAYMRERLAANLVKPGHRSEREYHGLPRELPS